MKREYKSSVIERRLHDRAISVYQWTPQYLPEDRAVIKREIEDGLFDVFRKYLKTSG